MIVQWETPEPARVKMSWRGHIDACFHNPCEWALVKQAARSHIATSLRRTAESRHGGVWESTQRKNEDGTFRVYLRYVGTPPELAPNSPPRIDLGAELDAEYPENHS